jgi:hypothetical protein
LRRGATAPLILQGLIISDRPPPPKSFVAAGMPTKTTKSPRMHNPYLTFRVGYNGRQPVTDVREHPWNTRKALQTARQEEQEVNAVEIEEAISALAEQPFDAQEFPFTFLEAFGNKPTTIKRLRSGAQTSPIWAASFRRTTSI